MTTERDDAPLHRPAVPITQLPFAFAKRHSVILKATAPDTLTLYYVPPFSVSVLTEIKRNFSGDYVLEPVEQEPFEMLLAQVYESGTEHALEAMSGFEEQMDLSALVHDLPAVEDLLEGADDAPVIRLINAVLSQAIKQLASDVHFEVFENKFSIRFRVDGVLHEILEPPRVLAPLIISRLKIMAKLDIAEKRLPQDGRISLRIAGRAVDVRISSIPTYYGERIVLRILDKQTVPLDLKRLSMSSDAYERLISLIRQPNGIILVTGPTGSGKSTTLYACLSELNDPSRNILTVEDPIEYYLMGIGQTQVNTKVGMTFARGLRAILRQDPDVIMVGEVRDLETAEMSVQASLTGHLVLSTLHTNTPIGAVTRLRDMGVEPFLLSSTLIGLVGQRLVRKLCDACKTPHVLDASECALLDIDIGQKTEVYEAAGCSQCAGTGYYGRMGIYEVVTVDESIRTMIHTGASEQAMERHIRESSPSMRADGFRLVQAGKTSVAEVLRITAGE